MRRFAVLALLLAGCDRPATPAPPPIAGPPAAEAPPPKPVWDALTGFEYKPGRTAFPEAVTSMNGRRVEIAGYLFPTRQTRDVKEFILMRDSGTCCYGAQAQWTHFLQVKIVDGPGVNFTRDPILVEGAFRLDERFDGDFQEGLYWLDAVSWRKP